jgi:NADH:ubiquinone oxidoreductase subunit K
VSGFWTSRRSLAVTWVSLALWVAITVVGAIVFASGQIIGLVVLIVGAVFTAVRVGVLWLTARRKPASTAHDATD